jgi:hypothetical protein
MYLLHPSGILLHISFFKKFLPPIQVIKLRIKSSSFLCCKYILYSKSISLCYYKSKHMFGVNLCHSLTTNSARQPLKRRWILRVRFM